MTINNFTFFSPNGTDFPVGSNNDAKLYMMLTGMDYKTIRRKDWLTPTNSGLNVIYNNTSIIAGGRYFELSFETVALNANSVNYIHANIDLTQTTRPVSLSAEKSDNSNSVDLNNALGVLKVLIDIRTTNGTDVTLQKAPDNVTYLDKAVINSIATTSGSLSIGRGVTINWQKKGDIVSIRWWGQITRVNAGETFFSKAPWQIIPKEEQQLAGHFVASSNSFHIDLEPDGTFRWWGENVTIPWEIRGNAVYFIK